MLEDDNFWPTILVVVVVSLMQLGAIYLTVNRTDGRVPACEIGSCK